jgi:hypothetical protein
MHKIWIEDPPRRHVGGGGAVQCVAFQPFTAFIAPETWPAGLSAD